MNTSSFLNATEGKRVDEIPVWFMRQAGRSLPGYRALREKYDVLTLTQTPELAAQVSLEPIERLSVDAAILFADIMLLPIALGVDVHIVDNVGPVIDKPLTSHGDIEKLRPFQTDAVAYLQKTIQILRNELKVPLIGFSGAPFTLASYLIEGKPSRSWTVTKRCMYGNPPIWNALMMKLSEAVISYLKMQIAAGVQTVQIFDSWVGCLSPADYRTYVLPHMKSIFSALSENGVPRIHFGTNTAGFLSDFSSIDCEVIGVDWRISLKDAKHVVGTKSLQGNLDPAVLLADWNDIKERADLLLSEIDPHQGYIFNLGHGILPETNDTIVRKLVEYVHSK
ncbi:MAG TPA: uroporphyrinogen decarboxylase [Candidatus Paceibacterota bacterium]|nr:uroporphyrinogen decarboxylase [Candidatus Paceibacterota bacterium]